jgi:hypothetical protein
MGEVRPWPQVHSRLDGIHDGSEFPPSSDITANQATDGVTRTCTFHADVGDAVHLQGGG